MTTTIDDPVGFVLRAIQFAADKHKDQRRKDKDASPYINHPIGAAAVLWHEAGIRDPIAIVSAILHDTVEDTETTLEELESAFGAEISDIVAEVTDDKALPKAERKRLQIEHAGHVSRRAQQVKIADKICNIRDVAMSPPAGWGVERCREYFEWAKAVVDVARVDHPELGALFDEAYARKP